MRNVTTTQASVRKTEMESLTLHGGWGALLKAGTQ